MKCIGVFIFMTGHVVSLSCGTCDGAWCWVWTWTLRWLRNPAQATVLSAVSFGRNVSREESLMYLSDTFCGSCSVWESLQKNYCTG